MSFESADTLLVPILTGVGSHTANNDTAFSVTFTHNLGFKPHVKVFQSEPSIAFWDKLPFPLLTETLGNCLVNGTVTYEVDEEKVVVQAQAYRSAIFSDGTWTFYFYLFDKRIDKL